MLEELWNGWTYEVTDFKTGYILYNPGETGPDRGCLRTGDGQYIIYPSIRTMLQMARCPSNEIDAIVRVKTHRCGA